MVNLEVLGGGTDFLDLLVVITDGTDSKSLIPLNPRKRTGPEAFGARQGKVMMVEERILAVENSEICGSPSSRRVGFSEPLAGKDVVTTSTFNEAICASREG